MSNTSRTEKTKKLVTVAMFCALAYISAFVFRFKVSFLTFDVKDAVITMGAMFCGPIFAPVISLIVAFLEMITVSDTEIYGMIMNFLSSCAFSFTASLIYKKKRTLNGAIVALFSGVIAMVAVMMAANLVITPIYTGMPTRDVAAMIPTLLLPFNFTKAVLNMAIVLLLYKPISNALKRGGLIPGDAASYKFDKKSALTLAFGGILLVLSLLVFIFYLRGDITIFKR